MDGQNFKNLSQQVAEGSQEAAKQLVELYGRHIITAVRRSLHHEMRAKFDSMDFAQAVWASVFVDVQRLRSFETPEALIRFLTTVARNKVVEEYRRRFQTQKYGMQREVRIDEPDTPWKDQLLSREPTPSAFAVAHETWEKMAQQMPEPYRQVLQWKMSGGTHEEIAAKLGVNERTVRRMLKKLAEIKRADERKSE